MNMVKTFTFGNADHFKGASFTKMASFMVMKIATNVVELASCHGT